MAGKTQTPPEDNAAPEENAAPEQNAAPEENGNAAPHSGISIVKPPVQATGISMDDAMEIAQALANVSDGEFVTTGETFPSAIEEKTNKAKETVRVDVGRARANATAHKFMRVIESRFDVNLRSRTWQDENGDWVFGICPKAEGEEGEPEQTEE